MENIFPFVVLFFIFGGWRLIPWVFRKLSGNDEPAGTPPSATGWAQSTRSQGSADNRYFGSFETRWRKGSVDDGDGPEGYFFEVRGQIPIQKKTNLRFVLSILDVTDGEGSPVFCPYEHFQEPETYAYQSVRDVGECRPGESLVDWVPAGVVFPEILETPYGGKRKLHVILRLVDANQPPEIALGYGEDGIARRDLALDIQVEGVGYKGEYENRKETRVLSLQMAMAVAMADGALDDTEGVVMKQWVKRILSTYEDSEAEAMKSRLNSAMRNAHEQAKKNNLSRSNLIEQINKLNDSAGSIEAIELCYDVMTADGKLDKSEMELIGQMSRALNIEDDDLEKIRSLKLAKVKGNMIRGEGIEGILGIDPTWPTERACAHLVKEFQRWNSRSSTLPSGAEQENAQQMLNMIAEARKKYAC